MVFEERGKPEFPGEKPSEQSRETNSAHIWRQVRESNPGHIAVTPTPSLPSLQTLQYVFSFNYCIALSWGVSLLD